MPGVEQRARQLARARTQVEHLEGVGSEQPLDRLARVSRAATLVLDRHAGEGARTLRPAGGGHVGIPAGAHGEWQRPEALAISTIAMATSRAE